MASQLHSSSETLSNPLHFHQVFAHLQRKILYLIVFFKYQHLKGSFTWYPTEKTRVAINRNLTVK